MTRRWWSPLVLLVTGLVPLYVVLTEQGSAADVLMAYGIEGSAVYLGWVVLARPTRRWVFYPGAVLVGLWLLMMVAGSFWPFYLDHREAGLATFLALLVSAGASLAWVLGRDRDHLGLSVAWRTLVLTIGGIFGVETAPSIGYLLRDGWVPAHLGDGPLSQVGDSFLIWLVDAGYSAAVVPVLMIVAFRTLNEVLVEIILVLRRTGEPDHADVESADRIGV